MGGSCEPSREGVRPVESAGDQDRGDAGAGAAAAPDEPRVLAAAGFPHIARLELDQLLDQLIERAQDVLLTQGRLRGLLRANHAIASAVDLDEVLRHILESARELVDARYAALGVIQQGRLVRFLHTGMDDQTVADIGHLPEGKGLLGRLIDYPRPLRTALIGAHESSVGFPDLHPPMTLFLGVPILIGQRVFGNLYLTDKQGADEFSRDDEELATALAAAAGAAINNAAAFSESQRRHQWQAAMAALSTEVLTSDDPDQAPWLILRHAAAAADCAGMSIAVPADDSDHLRVVAAGGFFADRVGLVTTVAGTIYEQVMTQRRAVLIDNLTADSRASDLRGAAAGCTVAVPMLTELATDGVLFLSRRVGAADFDAVDLEMLVTYAAHAALVLQLARSRRDNEVLRMVGDREHIAEGLHHEVIQRLSRLGMELQGLAVRGPDPKLGSVLQSKVEEIDEIMRALRVVISSLREG